MKNALFVTAIFLLTACPARQEESPSADPPADESNVVAVKKSRTTPPTPKTFTHGKKDAQKRPFNAPDYFLLMPRGWKKKDGFMSVDTMALSKPESGTDLFQENINVTLESLPSKMTAKAYFQANIGSMKSALQNFKQVSDRPIKLGAIDAHELIYQHSASGMTFQAKAVFVTSDLGGYVVTCTALKDTFGKFSPQFETAIKTFTLKY